MAAMSDFKGSYRGPAMSEIAEDEFANFATVKLTLKRP
jgi:hypothetical protein